MFKTLNCILVLDEIHRIEVESNEFKQEINKYIDKEISQ
jgi:nucleoside-triphosphatase THEP1